MDKTTTGSRAGEPSAVRSGTGSLSRCADLAGPRLYRDNAFAVTGLPANARGRAVRQHRQRLEARLAVRDTLPPDPDSPLVGERRKDEVRAAFEEFQDPRRRLVDELLWRWGDADLKCGCPRSLHEEHDDAVRFHAMVLEAEAGRGGVTVEGRDTLWRGAASGWGLLLGRPEFRQHIAHRIEDLDDPRLGEHTADDFLAALPPLLVSPLRELAADADFRTRLAGVCAGWTEHEVFAGLLAPLFEETVEDTVEQITEGLLSAKRQQEAGRYGDAALTLREQVLPTFERLGEFKAFVSEWRYEEVAHIVAVGLNNLAVALADHHLHGRPSAQQRQTMVELTEAAYEIAPDRDMQGIEANWDAIHSQFGQHARTVEAGGSGDVWGGLRLGCLLVLLVMVLPALIAYLVNR
ncbi:hypothetical protein [Streptomyces muensis]|uniref:Uncharacterized protein n=1 Tax=Streptomyces muensis TaxID=1077944 RepID=A0A9X1TK53_STRM4|nr:hypothetical protein [Streptomyces muensis]MCF1593680.1 hypothetical protein [Streptomyces muensis]